MEIGKLVADSGAFIRGAPLQKWSKTVVTVRDVIAEIRDKVTRERLQVLPYELSFREPSSDSIRHVTQFAKKTGDYGSLSPVDVRIIALTYQLHCELDSAAKAQLRNHPPKDRPIENRADVPNTAGFYTPQPKGNQHPPAHTGGTNDYHHSNKKGRKEKNVEQKQVKEEEKREVEEKEGEGVFSGGNSHSVAEQEVQCQNSIELSERLRKLHVENRDFERGNGGEGRNQNAMEVILLEEEEEEEGEDTEENEEVVEEAMEEEVDNSDNEGWINPDNFQQVCEEMGGVLEEPLNSLPVGCITLDFAMQNVLLQMGLNLISMDGMKIRQLRTYAKKCKGCFKTTTNTGLMFCPSCGNRSLYKVSVVVDSQGILHYRSLSQKQFSHKGLRYPLPMPKGGRHARNPILSPDQQVTYKERRRREVAVNPLDLDYMALASPFATHDVTSRGARLTMAAGRGGRSRRNPNAVKPKGCRK